MLFQTKNDLKRELLDIQTSANERTRWTPDATALEDHAFHLLFAWNRFQPEFYEYEQLIKEHCIHCAIGFTEEKFVMHKSDLGQNSYPIIMRSEHLVSGEIVGNIPQPRRIKGQLFYIMQEQIRNLDKIMQNGVEFRREYVDIMIPYHNLIKMAPMRYGKDAVGQAPGRTRAEYEAEFGTPHPSFHEPRTAIKKALCYVGVKSYWDDLLTPYQFPAVRHYHANNKAVGSYYHFQKRELFD